MKKYLILALALSTAMFSCGEKSEKGESHEEHDMEHSSDHKANPESSTLGETQATTAIIDSYLAVKDALVGDDQAATAKKSKDLVVAIQDFEAGDALAKLKSDALTHAEKLTSGDITTQRESFQALSVSLKDFLKIAGTDRTLYHQYCSMYKNNTGGMWLSASEDIKNPLFGSSMLTCGRVEESIAMN
jgi:hypothetical protein